MVASVSARSTGSMSSTAPPFIDTRAGGRWTASRGAVLRADEAELPVLVAPGRRGRHPVGLGAAGRLGGDHAPPGQELAVGEVGGRRRSGRPPARPAVHAGRAPRWSGTPGRRPRRPGPPRPPPGRARTARASRPAPARDGPSRPGPPRRSGRRPGRRRRTPSLRASALTARPCMPVTATRSTWSAVSAGRLEGRLPGLGARAGRSGSRRTAPPTPGTAGRRPCASGRGTRR